MIVVIVIGLIIGICVGFALNLTFPSAYSFYITMALLAALDSVVGAGRAHMEGKYDSLVFSTGFICNALLAAILTWLGDKLGIPLYYAAILVFGGRLFNNLAVMRRIAIDKYRERSKQDKQNIV